MTKIDCIIPFFNEGTRLIQVLEQVRKCRYIGNIYCVNDGSTDGFDTQKFSGDTRIKFLHHAKNAGKSQAVRTGLAHVDTDLVVLLDADTAGLLAEHIDACIRFMLRNTLDMLILRQSDALPYNKFALVDIVIAGHRILYTNIVRQALNSSAVGYQIESAINTFVIKHAVLCAWIQLPFTHVRKKDKIGLFSGIYGDLVSMAEINRYLGVINFVRQILFFRTVKSLNPKEVLIKS